MAIVRNWNDPNQWIDDQSGAIQSGPSDPFSENGNGSNGPPVSSTPVIKDQNLVIPDQGPTPWDIAHTPNGAGAPAPQNSGVGKTVRNWNDPTQWINDVTGAVQQATAGSGPGPSTFSDPATKQYEDLINSLIGRLNQPTNNPAFQPMMDWMTQYFQKLGQGQGYSPEQLHGMQTQSLDPLERDHQAKRQQVLEYMASRGMSPSSGPTIEALNQVDRHFETLGQQTRSQIATGNANIGMQQQAQASQLGPLIASLYQGQTNLNNNNALQGVQLAGLIPALEQSRIQTANSVINPISPASLFQPLLQAQNTGYTQNSDYMGQMLDMLFRLFGGSTH